MTNVAFTESTQCCVINRDNFEMVSTRLWLRKKQMFSTHTATLELNLFVYKLIIIQICLIFRAWLQKNCCGSKSVSMQITTSPCKYARGPQINETVSIAPMAKIFIDKRLIPSDLVDYSGNQYFILIYIY